MIIPLLPSRSSMGVTRYGPLDYQAIDGDPQFVYRYGIKRPRYCIIFIQASTEPLSPKLYVDFGDGFSEKNAISLAFTGNAIYSILIPASVVALRLDPSCAPARFRYWARFARNKPERDKFVVEARQYGEGRAFVHDIVVDATKVVAGDHTSANGTGPHFASVVRLAERTAPPLPFLFNEITPFISFVTPVCNTLEVYLDDLLASFRQQPPGWSELILSDDCSTSGATLSWLSRHENLRGVKVVRNPTKPGIAGATNSGIAASRGHWIGLVDHDDALAPHALNLIVQTAKEHPHCKFIYTDEVITDEHLRPLSYFFKPAFDPVLLSGVNYINHLACYRRDILVSIGGLRSEFDGSQDYDLILRYVKPLLKDEIKHLPYPAYLWRRTGQAFSVLNMEKATAAARRALFDRYKTDDLKPAVDKAITPTLHRVRFDRMIKTWPRVSIVIPNKDSFSLISRLFLDLAWRTDYPDLEIIVVDNGTTDFDVLGLYKLAERSMVSFKYLVKNDAFNFSRQVNLGVGLASGELILLLNNDIEVLAEDWLREMVMCLNYDNIGIVGAKLIYPNETLQHAGVIVGLGGLAGHWFVGQSKDCSGPMARLHVRQSVTAVTAACMLVSRRCWEKVGGFNEEEFGVAYNDIDFCLRALALGFGTVWTPFATLIHHESLSRGSDSVPANQPRFESEKQNLRRLHNTSSYSDAAYSPWYSRDSSEPIPVLLDRLPKAR